ncbi:MAG: hypothetical protein RJB13_1357, partial [Pseudomonadota bacterium]
KSIGVGDSRKLIVFSTDRAHRKAQNSRRRQQRSRSSNPNEGSNVDAEMAAVSGDEQNQQNRRPSRRRGRRGGNTHRPQQNTNTHFEGGQPEQDSEHREVTPEI